MDTVRSRFFWRGDLKKFKYHMVKWENVCLPKDFGGLGIINTRILNEALILKWAWRLHKLEGVIYVVSFLRQNISQISLLSRVMLPKAHNSGRGCKLFGGN
jgi:hypothetical protein